MLVNFSPNKCYFQRDEIQELPGHNIDIQEWEDEEEFVPRYNIAPRTQAPVIRRRAAGVGPSSSAPGPSSVQARDPNALIMQTMKWGLVPHWSKVEDKTLSTTNARSENLIEGGGMWASIKGKNRCAIPCQGYGLLYATDVSTKSLRLLSME